MAKMLILVRHGKSDWADLNLKDFERPLNHRGHKNAPEMAERMIKKGLHIDQMISSPALRALTTAKYFAKAYDMPSIATNPSIYEASTRTLMNLVNDLDDKQETIMLFGHNPGFTNFANELCDGDIYNIPTAGVVCISFPFDSWKMVSKETGELVFFDYPKNSDEI